MRALLLALSLLLVFFAAFGVGASVGLLGQGGLPDPSGGRPQSLDEGTATPRPQEKEGSRPSATDPGTTADANTSENTDNVASGATEDGVVAGKAERGGPADEVAYIHRATEANSRGDYTYLDTHGINGDADAIVLASPASGGTYDHNVGVWYDFVDRRRWAIFNQDRAPVPARSAFRVVVPDEAESFVHRASPENTSANVTYIDHPLVNGEPDAALSVTQNWNPGGGVGYYNDHPVGVRYDAGRGRWAVFNKDLAPIKAGVAFNVAVSRN